MKQLLIILTGILFMGPLFAQEEAEREPYRKYSIGIEFFNDFWMDTPDELEPEWQNRGFSTVFTYNIKTKIKNISFSPGLGITSRNIYGNALPVSDGGNGTVFQQIEEGLSYDKAKTNITYVDIPLELRWDPSDWHFAIGFRFSRFLSSHTKYKGEDPQDEGVNRIIKRNDVRFLESWMLGGSARIGYNWVHLSAYYSLTKLFKADLGPQMYPVSVGITFMPFKYR